MSLRPKKILLIGSEVTDLKPLAMACKDNRFDVIVAPDSRNSIEKLRLCDYDLLLFDLGLECLLSFDLIREVNGKVPKTPLVLLTQSLKQSQNLILGLFDLEIKGSWHVLEKPFNLELLPNLILEILEAEEKVISNKETVETVYFRENRKSFRQAKFSPIRLSYEQQKCESRFKTVTHGFLTDVSDGGIGLLTNRFLTENQYLSFESHLLCGTGRVVRTSSVDNMTSKVGIRFC